jgi:hypothetical protein
MWLSWIASGLTLLGNIILIGNKSWKSFVIFAIGNAMFSYYWFIREEWATFVLVLVFLAQNVWGLIKWRNESKRRGAIKI